MLRRMGATLATACMGLAIAGPAAADPITVIDQYGREVTLDGPAQRIITVPIPAASMIVAIDGGTDRLAGMHALSKSALLEGILGTFFPAARDIPSDMVGEGFMPNVEAIVAQGPDLVFQWGTRGNDIIDPLTDAGLNVLTLGYGTESLTREWIDIIARVTENDEKAGDLLAWRSDVRRTIEADLAELGDGERPRVVYFLRFLSSLRVAGEDTYNDFYIGLAGGSNPAAEAGSGWLDVNVEQVVAWDPEVIVLNGFESELSPADVYANPLFAEVTAVKDRRVYQVPLGGYRWDPPNQESPLMWMWLTELLHPALADYPLRQEIAETYGWIYGQTPTAAQIDGILRMEKNGGAAGYQAFAAE